MLAAIMTTILYCVIGLLLFLCESCSFFSCSLLLHVVQSQALITDPCTMKELAHLVGEMHELAGRMHT